MSSSPPKLRNDLTVSEQPTDGETVFVVKVPVTGQFFRLREAEWFIARQCDGTTPVEMIRQRAEEKFGAALTLESLSAFVKILEKAGVLETEPAARKNRKRQGRIRGSLLYLRVKLLDPAWLLDRLIGKVRFFFTPYFVVFAAALILLAAGIVATNLNEVGQSFGGLTLFSAIPVFLVVMFLVISAHEFAHGLTCKYFGGEVREMGFLLIYFQPALYCNVSDAWLFPEKSKRLWVGFAGPFFELFLWALATLAWRLTDVDTAINYVAFIVMAGSGINTLFNFNPLIKLDGYYLLSDYLGIPNLRNKSYRYIGDGIKKLTGRGVPVAREVSARERRAFLTYGLVATVGTFSVLVFALAKIGSFLIEQGQPLAFVLFSGLLGTKLRRRFRKFFGRSSRPTDLSNDDDDDDFDTTFAAEPAESAKTNHVKPEEMKPAEFRKTEPAESAEAAPVESPTPERAESPKAAPAESRKAEPAESSKAKSESRKKERAERRKKKRRAWMRCILLTALAGVTVAAVFLVELELRIVGAFSVLPRQNADVRSAIAGIIEGIYVDEGDEVKAGDLIARLSDFDLLAALRQTEAQINEARAKLKMLETGPTEDEIEVAKDAVSRAEEKVKYSQARLIRDKGLFEQNLLAQATFEVTEEMAVVAEKDLSEARGKLKILLGGSRPEEIDAEKATLYGLEAQRKYLEQQVQLLKIVSPAAGIVATPSRQLREMKSQLVNKGDLIAKVYDVKTVIAEMIIPEKEIADIKVGQEVALKARSYPDVTFHGRVTAIATAAQGAASSGIGQTTGPTIPTPISTSTKTILVTTEIDNSSLLLKAQMTGQAKIYCGQRRIIDLVMRRLSRTVKVEFWSWW